MLPGCKRSDGETRPGGTARACQRTRRTRQLREGDSRRAVGPVGGEGIDAGHHGREQRRREGRAGQGLQRVQQGTERAARCAGAALLFVAMTRLGRRGGRSGSGRAGAIFIGLCGRRVMRVSALRAAAGVFMRRSRPRPRLGCCHRAVVVRAAERHGRGGRALGGNGHNKQPHQKRSERQTHAAL